MSANSWSVPAEVIGVGVATWDRLLRVKAFPGSEGVTEVMASCESGGGPVATALCVLVKEGHSALLIDRVAGGVMGDRIRAGLERAGVRLAPLPEGVAAGVGATVLVREGDGARHILFQPDAVEEVGASEVRAEWFEGVKLLHVNGRHPEAARAAVELAKQAGAWVSFDGGAGRYREEIRDLVEASQLRIVAREFGVRWSGVSSVAEVGRALLSGPAEVVVVTDGLAGSWVWSRWGEAFHQPAICFGETVDSTGCGDAYHGAFLAGMLKGQPLRRCAELGSEWAGRTACGLGGRYALELP